MRRPRQGPGNAGAGAERPRAEAARQRSEVEALRKEVQGLEATCERLSKLYFTQVDQNRKRAQKLNQLLELVGRINATLDLEQLLGHIVNTIRQSLGLRIVLLRMREPGTPLLQARAFAGLDEEAQRQLMARPVLVADFLSWLREEFRVSHSYFISHKHSFSKILPAGFVPDLGERAEWEWHSQDILLVPLFSREGELLGYLSVDDPVDRLVPSQEVVELLELFGSHAVAAIENARLYQALEQRNRQLEEAGRRMQELNELKSNIVSTVSHELRTPVTAVQAYLDALLMAEGKVEPEQLRRFLGVMDQECKRLTRLIDSVLDLSRFDSGAVRVERRPVDLAEVVRETSALLQPLAQTAQVALKLPESTADTMVETDRDQMRQLVLHLGSNAVKFTPPGGEVRFELSVEDDAIVLAVVDTGIGIAEPEIERIFDRFYQVDSSLTRRYGGSGLGLAICKSIADWHGGQIQARSEPGHGSRFEVRLPRCAPSSIALRGDLPGGAAGADVLRMAVELVSEVMGARVVSIMGVTAAGELQILAAQGLEPRLVEEVRIPVGQGVAGWVAQQRRPVCVARPDEPADVSPSGRSQYRSGTFLSVPLEGARGLLGVLNVTDPVNRRPFAAEDCHLLLSLAERVSAAWEQAATLADGGEGAAETIRHLLRASPRGRRVTANRARLASALARRLGLSEAEAGVMGYVASFQEAGRGRLGEGVPGLGHDGEVGPGDGAAGAACGNAAGVRPLELVAAVRETILAEHEWWDGSGYPRGLRGEQIPVGARILAAVNAFESRTAGRSLAAPRRGTEAMEELRALAGARFDPRVVEALEAVLPEVELDDEPSSLDDQSAPSGLRR